MITFCRKPLWHPQALPWLPSQDWHCDPRGAPKQRGNLDRLDFCADPDEHDLGGDLDQLDPDGDLDVQINQCIRTFFSRARDGETDQTWRRWQQSTTIQPSSRLSPSWPTVGGCWLKRWWVDDNLWQKLRWQWRLWYEDKKDVELVKSAATLRVAIWAPPLLHPIPPRTAAGP